ncbi:amidohydrolase [Pseudalkalibacillus sp. A8]|uniref:amidohydrolase n=1 Tax=Pseudalkalibacillus sp. A8 TaxID=3382641 RepID=UPI0038B4B482
MTIINNVYIYRPGIKEDKQIHHIEIENGKIKAINKGRADTSSENVIDGNGATVTASFNDTHMHLLRYGLMKKELDLRKVRSWREMKEIVHDEYNEKMMEEHDWVIGRGVIDDQFEDIDHPLTAKELEELEYEKPMFFLHDDGHECIVNEEALKILRKEPELGKNHDRFIEKDEEGNWNGRFKDTAVHFIKFHFRNKTEEETYEAIEDAIPHLLENGITSVQTDDVNFAGSYDQVWRTYTDLEKDGKLPIKAQLHHYVYHVDDLKNFIVNDKKRTGDGTDRVTVGAFKIFLDGTQRLHTAALREPYHDQPETEGELIYTQEELNEMVKAADENNMQVAMHAIGDRAVEQALNAIEQVGAEKMRHRIIHAQVLAPDLLERLQKIKPFLEIQPGFMMDEYDKTGDWVGREREKYCNPWDTVDQLGIPYTGSSDSPIGDLSPLVNIFAGVNRTDKDGNPEGGWIPDEKLPLDKMYKSYTETGAYLDFQEDKKGKLEEGYVADLILLSDDPAEVEPHKLKDIQVMETWFDGERVYKKE